MKQVVDSYRDTFEYIDYSFKLWNQNIDDNNDALFACNDACNFVNCYLHIPNILMANDVVDN